MGRAIGIDLGTTNSCASVIEEGRPRLITYKGGNTTIPSMFAVDDQGRELVGHEAKRQAQLNPANTIAASKRLIGRNFHSKVIDHVRQVFTYELLEGEQSEVLVKVKDQVYSLEQISAAILRRIREVAEEALGEEVDQAVITVPAYFNDRQRQAVRRAGALANLKVLRILNEPTAAALAYGMGRNLNQRIAVYDLGGGTFDISVIEIKDRMFEVIATGGDTFLGGVDFDDRVMQRLLEDFHERHGLDLSWDRVAIQRIRDAAETAKIELSAMRRTRIHIPFIARGEEGPLDIDYELTREELESLTADLVERTLQTTRRILREAGTDPQSLDEMLLVGGQSRMPLVQRRVREFVGKQLSKAVNPDEAVAIGAGIMAHSLAHMDAENLSLLDVLPMPIGINRVDGTMHVLFRKNQPIPDYKTRILTTSKDDQTSIMLRLYQGEAEMVKDNELLGTFVFSGIRKAPKGKVQVEVTFHIDSEGILNLTARDKETGQVVESALKLGQKRKRRRKEETGEAPKPPPEPLTMPRSSLAGEIGGEAGGSGAPAEDRSEATEGGPDAPAEGTPSTRPADEVVSAARQDARRASLWERVTGWFRSLLG